MNGPRIEELVQKVQAARDSACRDAALELVQAVMELHAEALERMMNLIHETGNAEKLFEACAQDEQVSSLLLLHNLHPWDLETRVRQALARPSLGGRGASAELVSVRDGVVRVRLEGGPAFRNAVEKALAEEAPDAANFVIEGGEMTHPAADFVPLTQLVAR